MNIEFEMNINEEDEKDNSNLMLYLGNTEKHEALFSAETSSLYSSTREEAKYDIDYEINLKIDHSTFLYDTINNSI